MKTTYTYLLIVLVIITNSISAQDKNLKSIIEGNNNFGFELVKKLHKPGENISISPFSLSSAMASVYLGSDNGTKNEIREVMNYLKVPSINFENWVKNKNKIPKSILMADGIWIDKSFNPEYPFISKLENTNYKLESVNFQSNKKRKKAIGKINQWVSKSTQRNIPNLLKPDDVSNETQLIIINSVFFNQKWIKSFDPNANKRAAFLAENKEIECEYMKQTNEYKFYSDRMIKVIELPYMNEQTSMLIILPHQNIQLEVALEDFDNCQLNAIKSEFRNERVDLSLPKFKLNQRMYLKKTLVSMGMTSAFTGSADFSKIDKTKGIFIDNVIHQTVVEISESGTKASASTAVTMGRSSKTESNKPKIFNANRPFMFLIIDKEVGNIIFSGIVENPNIN